MTAPHSASADPRRRLMIMVGVGAALGVLLFFGGRVLAAGSGGSGGPGEDAANFGAPALPATATPVKVAAGSEAQAAAPVETFEVLTTRDPFIALRTTAAATGTGSAPPAVPAAPAGPTAATGAPPAATPVAAPVATNMAGSAGSAGATTADATTATGGQATEPGPSVTRVALLDVLAEGNRTVANVRVNDTVSKVGGGDSFSSNFKVVSLDAAGGCGRFLYGDDQFRLCKGEEILK